MAKENGKGRVARKLWLRYFNRTLRDAKLLSEREYLAMVRVIDAD